MDKAYLKTLIATRQAEFPTDLKKRENPLPVGGGKIVIIPGVRRCGKTSRMEAVVNELLANGIARERFLWVGFDDERLVKMTSDELNLIIEAYREMYPGIEMKTVYMFFDEIQLIENWEYFIMRLFRHHSKNIYISGSNATMLSSELKTALRGWPEEEETLPLSFNEYCRFLDINTNSWLESDMARIRNAFVDFNNEGGFPEVVLTNNPFKKNKILQSYFDTMLLKDLAEHYGVSNIEVLRYYLKRIMANLTKPTSIRGIYGDIKSKGLKVSKDNLYDWVGYACGIFMFFPVSNYSKSLQKTESSQPKYYCIDNGLRNAVLLPQSDDAGKKLENTVFLQLYRQKTPVDRIFYYLGKKECDFIVQRGTDIHQLIQVCWSIDENESREREIKGLLEASSATGCNNMLLITAEQEEEIRMEDGRLIRVVPAWKWSLGGTF
ncbi:MAG: ATP-binding protein [Bacteroides sp.]|nr:ATP-binding protein [Bacteroides sp.]MCM1531160.1 ATP-binding protein [Ruminococcus flavefaciens]MCM1555101.1 ATP-binding protein [Bacteroides sp.]